MRKTETPEGRSVRLLRVGEQARHILSELLARGDVHDETLQSHLVSVTEVRMSPDLRHATVFVKPLLGQDEAAVLKALRTNTAFLQREVAKRVRLKYAAKLKFLADDSFDEGMHIDRLLRDPKVAQDLSDKIVIPERMMDRHPREGGDPPQAKKLDSRLRGNDDELARRMTGEDCRAEPYAEAYREPLKAACAEDSDIWQIYANDFGPAGFDASIDRYTFNPSTRTFVLFDGNELAGMSSFLGIDEARQCVEVGGTYYRPHLRGTGFNRRVKQMMIARAFDCGFRRIEFRVDRRNARSQAAMKKLGAVREGVLRADRITWTGHVRDTVLFAILRDEWPIAGAAQA